MMDIEKYREEALKQNIKHKKYLEKLKKKKPKKIDERIVEIHEEVFQEIDCLECANCCKTTGPLIIEKDIERIAKYLRLKSSVFVQHYLYKDEDNDWVLKQLPCPFLDSENYCLIYEVRPKACREYPHTNRKNFFQINALTLKNTLICPAAYRIVEEIMRKIPL